jgi:hypothetical protein
MAIINKTGITTGGTIEAEHVTRAIDALSGGSTDTIVATGSFSGFLVGTASFATTAQTASYVLNAVSSSFAATASFALNAGGGSGVGFPFTGSARITGSLIVTGSFTQTSPSMGVLINSNTSGMMSLQSSTINVSSSVNFNGNSGLDLSAMSKGPGFRIPIDDPGANENTGSMYFDAPNATLWIYDGTTWRGFEPTLP